MRLTSERPARLCHDAAWRGRSAAALALVAVLGFSARATAQGFQPPSYGPYGAAPGAYDGAAPPPPSDPQHPTLQRYAVPPPSLPPWANPRTIEFKEGDPLVPGYLLRTRPNRALLVSGIVTLGTSYGLSLITSSLVLGFGDNNDDNGITAPLLIPFVGPIIALSLGDAEGPGVFMLALDEGLQTAGLLLIAAGLAHEDLYLQRHNVDVSRDASPAGSLRPEVSIGLSSANLRWRF